MKKILVPFCLGLFAVLFLLLTGMPQGSWAGEPTPTAEFSLHMPLVARNATAPTPTPLPPDYGQRRVTGDGGTSPFYTGEAVYGFQIDLSDGSACNVGGCWLPSAPMPGTVTSGVINPWSDEVPTDTVPWDWTTTFWWRRATGDGESLEFDTGEEIFGYQIELASGEICNKGNCWLTEAPVTGTVTSGVINPWSDEVPSDAVPWDWTDPTFYRRETGDGGTQEFYPGEEVIGVIITLGSGQTCDPTIAEPCWLPSAPITGTVETGVVNPYSEEIPIDAQPWDPTP